MSRHGRLVFNTVVLAFLAGFSLGIGSIAAKEPPAPPMLQPLFPDWMQFIPSDFVPPEVVWNSPGRYSERGPARSASASPQTTPVQSPKLPFDENTEQLLAEIRARQGRVTGDSSSPNDAKFIKAIRRVAKEAEPVTAAVSAPTPETTSKRVTSTESARPVFISERHDPKMAAQRIEMLWSLSAELDALANRMERQELFEQADGIREQSDRLRKQARETLASHPDVRASVRERTQANEFPVKSATPYAYPPSYYPAAPAYAPPSSAHPATSYNDPGYVPSAPVAVPAPAFDLPTVPAPVPDAEPRPHQSGSIQSEERHLFPGSWTRLRDSGIVAKKIRNFTFFISGRR